MTSRHWKLFCVTIRCWGNHHDDVIKWKHFPRNWPFVREIHRSPVKFPHKGQWRGALMFSLIYAWINDWVNNREAGDLRRQHGHYDVIVMTRMNGQRFDIFLYQPQQTLDQTVDFLVTSDGLDELDGNVIFYIWLLMNHVPVYSTRYYSVLKSHILKKTCHRFQPNHQNSPTKHESVSNYRFIFLWNHLRYAIIKDHLVR